MIGSTVSHYKILKKLGEARLRSITRSFVERSGPARRNLSMEIDK